MANGKVGGAKRLRVPAIFSAILAALLLAILGAALLPIGAARADGGPIIQAPTATPTSKPTRTPTPRIPRLAPTATPSPTPATYRRVIPGVSNEVLPTPEAPPQQAPPKAPPEMATLRTSLQSAINRFPVSGAYAIAVTDLQTGKSVDVKGDSYQLSGCIMNIFVLVSALLDVQQGAYSLDDVSQTIAATIWSSNTVTARTLYRKTGGNNLAAGVRKVGRLINERMGMVNTLIDHPPGYPAETLGRDPNNWISANDTNRGLVALWNGTILHDPYRVYLLDALVEVSPTLNYLLAYNPHGRVSHKNGWLFEDGGWVDNDAGIVRFVKDGKEYAYAITFMSQDVDQFKAEVPLGQQLARITWDWFNANYP
ncbi:MAG: serine hydrolase [Tepidiformaceae bacterium]